MINYRKYYQDRLGVILPKGFDVHHIDEDRENNDIDNLVALPKNIHLNYHAARRCMYGFENNGFHTEISFHNCNRGLGFELGIIEEFHDALRECFIYIAYRDALLDVAPGCLVDVGKLY